MHVHRRTERDPRWNTVSIVVQGAMNALDPVMRVSDQIRHGDLAARPGRRRRLVCDEPVSALDVARIPSGCRFHPRCPVAFDRCKTDDPAELIGVGGSHAAACWKVGG